MQNIYAIIISFGYQSIANAILIEEVKEDLKEIIYSIAEDHDIKILELEIMPDHVHLFISTVPRYSPSYLANLLKGVSARKLRIKHPELKRKDGIWTRSYFVVSSDTIKKYIEEQGESENEEN